MLQVEMSASLRTATGKGAMRRMRSEGVTPAVVYGTGAAAQLLQMDTKNLTASLLEIARKNSVVTLKLDDGTTKHVVVKEIQTDPVTDTLVHTDFCEIDLEQEQKFRVPITITGVAKGVDLGGVLEEYASSIEVIGKPLAIPNECELNVKKLNIGDELTFGDITLPEGVRLVSPATKVCVGVIKKVGK